MARPIVLSNGRMMVCLDENGLVHDFYYPFVGQDNLTNARSIHHKLGVWVDGDFSWVDDGTWNTSFKYADNALVGNTTMQSMRLGITLLVTDFVDQEHDILCRSVIIQNNTLEYKEVRIFFHQVFQISRAGRRDSALYVPSNHPYILTYQGNLTFVSGLRTQEGKPFDQHAVGNYMIEGKSGTWVDAEDGELSNNNVEHGGVDSVIRASAKLNPSESWGVDYWVSASTKTYHKASEVHRAVSINGLKTKLEQTTTYWQQWLKPALDLLPKIEPKYHTFFINSLLIIKAHIDERGGVLASGDSSIYNYGRDYYSYVWPRDAVYALLPFVRIGYQKEALNFLMFSKNVLHPRGYLHHKYQPDGAIGSTWQPMVQGGRPELNVQEDETAMLVILFKKLSEVCEDTGSLDIIYQDLIKPALNFLARYIDDATGLPHASYDLWEQQFISSTYTVAVVIQALRDGISIAHERAEGEEVARWQVSLDTIEANFPKLFADREQYYSKGILLQGAGVATMDRKLDSSTFYALFQYQPLPLDDTSVQATILAAEQTLNNQTPIGGMVRYSGDTYMSTNHQYVGNPWFVCTYWLAQFYIKIGKLDDARVIIDRSMGLALSTGVLSEQIDPEAGYAVGVAPLVWSHAELVNTLLDLYK